MNENHETNYGNNTHPSNFTFNNQNNNVGYFTDANQSFNNFNNNLNNTEDFNRNMNNIVKSNLQSRGISFKNNNHDRSMTKSPYRHDKDKKKLLLNSIQQQIGMTKNSKFLELEKRRKEDEKYLTEMSSSYPFGRYLE
jgi:hypothetical protein